MPLMDACVSLLAQGERIDNIDWLGVQVHL